jgi:two-component system LytT family response regulator
MPTALLVDDEPLASARMRDLLSAHPEIDVVGVATSVAEARAFLESRPPDVVFLDVEMPGGTGFDLLASVPDDTQVVFVTAREKYAVQAFAAAALDYLLKPVDPERLADTVARIQAQAAGKRARPQGDGDPDADDLESDEATEWPVLGLEDVVSVTLAGKTTAAALTVGDICWIESLRNYTRVALKGPPRVVLFRRRLSEWDECLPGEHFARVGRSCIVQLSTIDQIEWKSRAETTVTFGAGVEPLALGRLPATRLREILGGEG